MRTGNRIITTGNSFNIFISQREAGGGREEVHRGQSPEDH